jgi:MerR family transcriptional regulator, heat shock protein HspR
MLECCAVFPFEDENLPLFTVGQVAQMLEVQQAFLRRLDEFGVVRPSRSSGGQRRYSRTEITIVRYVSQLAEEGMTLAAIRRVLELEDQVRALEAERDALLTALAERDELLAALTSHRRRSDPPLLEQRTSGSTAPLRRGGQQRQWLRGSTPRSHDDVRDRPEV